MQKRVKPFLIVLLFGIAAPLFALTEQQESRYLDLLKELRCLVCPNQSLAESGAGLAADLRNEIRHKIEQGESNEEIKQFAAERYSDFILYKPRFKPQTYVLWIAPFVLLVVALLLLFRQISKQQKQLK